MHKLSSPFTRTADQQNAVKLLKSRAASILLFGGSRSGKTFILIYAIICRALQAPESRHVILRYRFNAVKQSVGYDTLPKVMKLAFPRLRYELNRSDWFVRLSNGSEIWLGGLDDHDRVDKILGKEYATVYFNECSEISYHAVTTAMSRLAQRTAVPNKAFFDCNPSGKSHWSYQLFVQKIEPQGKTPLKFPERYACMQMNPKGNSANLPEDYIEETLAGLPERQRQRFLDGSWLDDMAGALWRRSMIEPFRVANPPLLIRIVIGVDPAVTSRPDSDETGIVAAGLGTDNHYYVLGDASLQGSPAQWAAAVDDQYRYFRADRVVAEVNNGGDLIVANLRNVNPAISCRSITATRGKLVRAEPIAALYELERVHHVGIFPELEDQMCNYNPSMTAYSPDRMDALVWALTELSGSNGGSRAIMA